MDKMYNKLRIILNGVKTHEDAIRIINILKLENNEIVKNIIRSKHIASNMLDFKKINDEIDKLLKLKYKNNVFDYISAYLRDISDLAQLNVFYRIANMKSYKNIDFTNMMTKKCPHCGHLMSMPIGTIYVVCGYANEEDGFDWKGCQKDWCFKCGKKLCKSWGIDELHIPENRIHNIECCRNMAKLNNESYEDNYCHCNI